MFVCLGGGSTWRSNSRNSGKADIRTVSTALEHALSPLQIRPRYLWILGEASSTQGQIPSGRSQSFQPVSGLECGRMQVFYEACSMNICHWPFGLLKLTISLVISTTSFQCPLTLPS